MRVNLVKENPLLELTETLVHIEVSDFDDLPNFTYSHSFKYRVPSGTDEKGKLYGEIIVYSDKDAASNNSNGTSYSFELEECHNKDCEKENPDGCPVIPGESNRLLVADIFHTEPTQDSLHRFGTALFKALFSDCAGKLLQKIKPTDTNGQIFLQLIEGDDLDAIPWEYAKVYNALFLVHQRRFSRLYERRQEPLPKLPLRIVVAVPDPVIPLDDPNPNLPDLSLSQQFQNFIVGRNFNKKVELERVFPPTVNQMEALLMNEFKASTVLHFIGHCESNNGTRALIFEQHGTGKHEFVDALRPSLPKQLRLAYLSACNTREIARDLLERGVPYTIGSHCLIPNDLARKFESEFYKFIAGGLSVGEAMFRARISFQYEGNIRQNDYLAGAMVLYSSTIQENSGIFECKEDNKPEVQFHMPLNNLELLPLRSIFCGRKKELVELDSILRDMADRNRQTCHVCTILGIGGQGKTALAIEAVRRTAHLFPGGIFAWPFDREPISIIDYLRQLADVLFPEIQLKPRSWDYKVNVRELQLAIIKAFVNHPPCLLILDHVDTLRLAERQGEEDAVALVTWLKELTSRQDFAVKILTTSQENLGWPKEETIHLNGLTDWDIHSGCRLFVDNLNLKVRERIEKEENYRTLLRELVARVDGHPLTLELLGRAASLPKYFDKPLEDIVHEHYSKMFTDVDWASKSLENCFRPTIDRLSTQQRLVLYMCCLFTGPITDGIVGFVSYFVDSSGTSTDDFGVEAIATQLQQLSDRKLLKSTKEGSYSIHIALKEAVKQRNTDLRLRPYLQISGKYDDIFVIGVISSHHKKSAMLEWQFNNMKSNPLSRLTTGIEYYSIKNTGCHIIDISANNDNNVAEVTMQYTPPTQLIVFIFKASETLWADISRFCKHLIVPIVSERKLPFIVVYEHDRPVIGDSGGMVEVSVQMKKVAETLQENLKETYKIIETEPLPTNFQNSNMVNAKINPTAALKDSVNVNRKTTPSAHRRFLASVYTSETFVGRQKELENLGKLLNNDNYRYINIKGFGGIGKTSLALQAAENFSSGSALALSLVGTPTLSSVITKMARFLELNIKELELQEQQSAIIDKLVGEGTFLLYLDSVDDIKITADQGDSEAKALMQFFRRMPNNVKTLATSRVTLGWPYEEIVELDGLTPHDGMLVFRQWISQRNSEVDDHRAMKLSDLVHGYSLSLRLLGVMFNDCEESIDEFIDHLDDWLAKAIENNATTERHRSINACMEYSFSKLDPTLRLLLARLKIFRVPFTKTLALKVLDGNTASSLASTSSLADNLHKLWQHSWLNRHTYEAVLDGNITSPLASASSVADNLHGLSWMNRHIYGADSMLGNWLPRFIEEDTKFYSIHYILHKFLDQQSSYAEDADLISWNDPSFQFYTALCYGVGFGVAYDLERQIEWETKAATNGHLEAQLSLATCYDAGCSGVYEDQENAFYWYLKAAEAGHQGAQQEISNRYFYGNGVKKDKDKGKWWEKRANENKTIPLKIKFDLSFPLIHRATECGQIDLVRSQMEQTLTTAVIKDKHGRIPLHIAAEKGRIDILKLLAFEFHVDINVKKKDGKTSLHGAARNGHVEVVRLLVVELGADVNAKDNNGRTPLHDAVAEEHVEVVRFLLTCSGVQAYAEDRSNRTPLHLAVESGHVEIGTLLVAVLGEDTTPSSTLLPGSNASKSPN